MHIYNRNSSVQETHSYIGLQAYSGMEDIRQSSSHPCDVTKSRVMHACPVWQLYEMVVAVVVVVAVVGLVVAFMAVVVNVVAVVVVVAVFVSVMAVNVWGFVVKC